MEVGYNGLKAMFKKAKKDKEYSRDQLGEIDNALANVQPFIDYKKAEFVK